MVCRAILFRGILITNPTNHGRDGSVVEYKQGLVNKSRYHEQLEEEFLSTSPNEPGPDPIQPDPFVVDESAVRHWSDYNRVDYHPRSIHKLPDLPDWDLGMGDWVAGKEMFDKYNNQVNRTLGVVVVAPYSFVLGWVFTDGRLREVFCRGMRLAPGSSFLEPVRSV